MFLKLLPDKRHWKWFWQRRKFGFDEREIWNLDCTIISFIIPRLKVFRKNLVGWPDQNFRSHRDWERAIDKMIEAFELHKKRDGVPFLWPNPTAEDQHKENEEHKKFNEGFELFVKYFHNLWT